MKRITRSLFFILLSMSMMTTAQEKKEFTLDDLTPGGSNYYNCAVRPLRGIKWWGDVCLRADVEEAMQIDLRSGKETPFISLSDVNEAISRQAFPANFSKKLKPLRQLGYVTFPKAEEPVMRCELRDEESGVYDAFYNFQQKKFVRIYLLASAQQGAAENLDYCTANEMTAYTVGRNLLVSGQAKQAIQINPKYEGDAKNDPEREVVYGHTIHRDEFGVTKGTFWSPKGTYLAFYRQDESMVADYPQVDISTRIATLVPDKYPMAGCTSHKVTVGVYDTRNGKMHYLQAGDPTDRYFTNLTWSPDEQRIYLIELNRDQNHAELVAYNAATGEKEEVIYEEKHPKYVEPLHPLTFLPWNNQQFIYQSQRDGFNHLYLFDLSKKGAQPETFQQAKAGGTYRESVKVTPMTSGNWLVTELVGFNLKKKEAIIASTEVSPTQENLYAVEFSKGTRRALCNGEGVHFPILSPSGNYLVDRYTSPTVPYNTELVNTANGRRVLLNEAKDPWTAYNVPSIEMGTIKAADGVTDLYYRLTKPSNFDPNKKYPAIIYVYGGPHAQLVLSSYRYFARSWEVYMAQQGYILLTVDGRGSDHRGIEFENCTFRYLGQEEAKDQLKAAEFLKSLPYVDGDRLGVHGWSFGGYMTINLMLTYPDLFKVGVAGGPVIDWKYYEVMYGERYMDTPEANPEGYKARSLNERAGNLRGRLQIIYGGNDPTCVPQHTLSFIRSSIDQGTHPDLFVYPGQGHNMAGKDRVHLEEHITRYFNDFLK